MKEATEEQTMADKYDLVIVGGGPAGASAAIFAARAGLRSLIRCRNQSVEGFASAPGLFAHFRPN